MAELQFLIMLLIGLNIVYYCYDDYKIAKQDDDELTDVYFLIIFIETIVLYIIALWFYANYDINVVNSMPVINYILCIIVYIVMGVIVQTIKEGILRQLRLR